MRYDDTWHGLQVSVEKSGRRLVAARALPLSDHEWVVDTWQEPGPDDRPTKGKTWTTLEPHGASATPATAAPNEIKVTLELTRSSQLRARWFKIARNYRLTFGRG